MVTASGTAPATVAVSPAASVFCNSTTFLVSATRTQDSARACSTSSSGASTAATGADAGTTGTAGTAAEDGANGVTATATSRGATGSACCTTCAGESVVTGAAAENQPVARNWGQKVINAAPTNKANTANTTGRDRYSNQDLRGWPSLCLTAVLVAVLGLAQGVWEAAGSLESTSSGFSLTCRHTLAASARTKTRSDRDSSCPASKASSLATDTLRDAASTSIRKPKASRARRIRAPASAAEPPSVSAAAAPPTSSLIKRPFFVGC